TSTPCGRTSRSTRSESRAARDIDMGRLKSGLSPDFNRPAPTSSGRPVRTGGGRTDDARVLRYLRGCWKRLFRLTTVAQAMVALDLPPDPEQRLRIGDHLLAHPELHPTLGRWGARTFILTDDEKRLGRYLALHPRGVAGRRSAARAGVVLGRTP